MSSHHFSVLDLTKQLIQKNSVTPNDSGCMDIIIDYLAPYGFEPYFINSHDVRNVWLVKKAANVNAHTKTFAFAGHTDVVPTGPLDEWHTPPFEPTTKDGKLYGRGTSDMKSSIAAFMFAVKKFVQSYEKHQYNLALLLTSDEEGPAVDGTVKVIEWLTQNSIQLDYCIVGEPTAVDTLGDMIKNGRRGSLSGNLRILGVQGHIAYPHLAKNPIHLVAPAIVDLNQQVWDIEENTFFGPTAFQISNIHAGTGANNVIAGHVDILFNFRFSTSSTPDFLKQRVESILAKHNLDYEIKWTLGGEPFLTQPNVLSKTIGAAIKKVCGIDTALSTSGGTSDARFIAKICKEVIECGPPNATIHQINEHIELRFLEPLAEVYYQTLVGLEEILYS
jgi:succinyl-diaminopimelate desuccinylase